MSVNGNKKKDAQLGMSHGKATGKLRRAILFNYATKCNENICFRCNKIIDNIDNFSVDHKIAWLDSEDPVGLFFDLDNVAFSHIDCNARNHRVVKRPRNHGQSLYKDGCRCEICYESQVVHNRRRY
jgi:hypothetical protein